VPEVETVLAAEFNARNGVTTSARLRRMGISERSARRLVANGRLRRAARGVLVSVAWPISLDHRMALACAVTGGVVSFPTAGEVWNLRKSPGSADVHLWIPENRRLQAPLGVQLHRTSQLPPGDVVRRSDGVAVTSPPRTAFDAARWLTNDDLESLIECGIRASYFTVPTLWGTGRRLCSRGRPGSTRFAEVLGAREPWRKPVDSDYELRLERALRKRGFPPLERQCRLQLPNGKVIHPDLGIPELGFYVEVDHLTWHGGRMAADYDCQRDLEIGALGHHVERVTDLAIDHHLDATVELLWTIWQRELRSQAVENGRVSSEVQQTLR
jgi:hypothetical protein